MLSNAQGSQPAGDTASAQVQDSPELAETSSFDLARISADLAKTLEKPTEQAAGEEENKGRREPIEEEIPDVVEDPDADLVIEGEPEAPTKRILPNRISVAQFNDVEQEAIALRRQLNNDGDKVSLKEAIELVEHRRAEKPAEQRQETETKEVSGIDALMTRRAELLQQRRELAEVDPFDPSIADVETQIEEVRDQIAETKALTKLEDQRKQEQITKGKEEAISARETVKQQTLAVYPSAGDDKSPLGREVAKVIAEFSDPKHPDHPMLFATKAPKLVIEEAVDRIADRVSRARGLTREQVINSLRAKDSSSTVQTQERTPVRPVSGARQTDPAQKALTGQELIDYAGFDPKKIDEALKATLSPSNGTWVVR